MSREKQKGEDLAAYFPDEPVVAGANFDLPDPTRLPDDTYRPENYELFWAAKDRVGMYKQQGCVVHPRPPDTIDDAHAGNTMVLMAIHKKTKAANRRRNCEFASGHVSATAEKFQAEAGKAFVPVK